MMASIGNASRPGEEDVRAQLVRLHAWRKFRGRKCRDLLDFVIAESLAGRGSKLTLRYIAEAIGDEPLTFESHSDRWGFPKTRSNLGQIRLRLTEYYRTKGYGDPVIIKLAAGCYVPLIVENPVIAAIRDLNPTVKGLLLQEPQLRDRPLGHCRLRAEMTSRTAAKSEKAAADVPEMDEMLAALFEFTAAENLRRAINSALVYEAQRRLHEAMAELERLIRQ